MTTVPRSLSCRDCHFHTPQKAPQFFCKTLGIVGDESTKLLRYSISAPGRSSYHLEAQFYCWTHRDFYVKYGMAPPLLSAAHITIYPEPLTPFSFVPFGTAIMSPLAPSQSSIPVNFPSLHPTDDPKPQIVNQSTALKYSPISPLTNDYASVQPQAPLSKPQMSLFCCFPRKIVNNSFSVSILERHPFTTQTFSPLGLAAPSATAAATHKEIHKECGGDACYLVIVAPSVHGLIALADGGKTRVHKPPDLQQLRAFVATCGQAVTYAPGTWHAPMVVLGKRRIDFLVTQFVDGVADHDCQEVRISDGVSVALKGMRARL